MKAPDADEEPLTLQSYLPATVAATWQNLPQLLVAGMGFSLACAPAFVLAVLALPWLALLAAVLLAMPAWVTLLWFATRQLEGRADGISTLWPTFRHLWRRGVRLGIDGIGLPALAFTVATWLLAPFFEAGWPGALLLLPALLVVAIAAIYAAPLLATHGIAVPVAERNGFLLATRYLSHTFGLLAMAVLMALAVLYVSPGFLFVLPTFFAMFVANNCRLALALEAEQ